MSMSEDTTRDLPGATAFEQRVLAEFAALRQEMGGLRQDVTSINGRLTALEEKVDRRLMETRPIWEGVQSRLARIEETLGEIRSQMNLVIKDLFKMRARIEDLEDRRLPPAA